MKALITRHLNISGLFPQCVDSVQRTAPSGNTSIPPEGYQS